MTPGGWSWWPGWGPFIGFALGWLAGWLALFRCRPLPAPTLTSTDPVAVIVPARNEAAAIAAVVGPLVGRGDDVVVVDDASTDGTGAIAAATGARVIERTGPPAGWLGKPAACRAGVDATTAPVLVFVDADVSPPADLTARLAAVVDARPDALVSVQPWHVPGRPAEQLSLPFNVVALMGSGACLPWRRRRALAFGPVLACRRSRYEDVGGHGDATVRATVAEDIALGRRFGETVVFSGRTGVTFRMFPGGGRQVVDGWTKHVAVGATAAGRLPALLVVAWVWSQVAGWALGPLCGMLATIQLGVLARRAGRFAWWAVLAGPLLFGVFSVVVLRSFLRRARRRPVRWKDRWVGMG